MKLLMLCATVLLVSSLAAAQSVNVSGYVLEQDTRKRLRDAEVEHVVSQNKIFSRADGSYTITIPAVDTIIFIVRLKGYEEIEERISIPANTENITHDIVLIPSKYRASEIVVEAEKVTPYLLPPSQRLTAEDIKLLPVIGEADVQRAMLLLPGVTVTGNDFFSQLVVRGGDQTQHLTLLDATPLYNPYHLAGFLGTVNPDILSESNLFPSAYPPNFGGAVSSVFSMRTKDQIPEKLHFNAAIGLASSKAAVQMPLGNGSLQLAARRTYLDLIFRAFVKTDFPYTFYDLFGKYQWQLDKRHYFSASVFFTRDNFGNADPNLFSPQLAGTQIQPYWGNLLGSAEWQWRISNAHTLSTIAYSTSAILRANLGGFYNDGVGVVERASLNQLDNFVVEQGIKSKYEWQWGQHRISGGLEAASLRLQHRWQFLSRYSGPQVIPFGDETVFFDNAPPIYQNALSRIKAAAFIADKFSLAPHTTLTLGGRAEYLSDQSQLFLSPFAHADYRLDDRTTLTASYGRYYQSLVTLAERFNSFRLPGFKVFFFPEKGKVPTADHLTLGLTYTDAASGLSLTAETYFLVKHEMPFISIFDNSPQTYSEQTIGLDAMVRYKQGAFEGWISGSLGKATRIEGDLRFSGLFDQRLSLKAFSAYRFLGCLDLSASWIVSTGLPYSEPTNEFVSGVGSDQPLYAVFNGNRAPPYHRLDATLTFNFVAFSALAKFYLTVINVYSYDNTFQITNPSGFNQTPAIPVALPLVGITFEL